MPQWGLQKARLPQSLMRAMRHLPILFIDLVHTPAILISLNEICWAFEMTYKSISPDVSGHIGLPTTSRRSQCPSRIIGFSLIIGAWEVTHAFHAGLQDDDAPGMLLSPVLIFTFFLAAYIIEKCIYFYNGFTSHFLDDTRWVLKFWRISFTITAIWPRRYEISIIHAYRVYWVDSQWPAIFHTISDMIEYIFPDIKYRTLLKERWEMAPVIAAFIPLYMPLI